jgi:protein-disulfide isomerase
MSVQREPGRVVLSLERRHLWASAIVLAGAIVGVVLFFALRPVLPVTSDTAAMRVATDSVAWMEAPRVAVSTDGRPSLGPTDAPVTIVEFTDYGCPVCRRHAVDVLPALLDSVGTSVRYVVRHFPIPGLTPNAMLAATAAECAHRQGRFWEYKTALQGGASSFEMETVRAHAATVGLDVQAFDACLEGDSSRRAVERDLLDAWEAGVIGTPTFVINGRQLRGARSLESLLAYVRFAMRS